LFDEPQGVIDFRPFGKSQGFGHIADRERISSSLKAEGAIVRIAFFADDSDRVS
jgi:hypothetical protein